MAREQRGDDRVKAFRFTCEINLIGFDPKDVLTCEPGAVVDVQLPFNSDDFKTSAVEELAEAINEHRLSYGLGPLKVTKVAIHNDCRLVMENQALV